MVAYAGLPRSSNHSYSTHASHLVYLWCTMLLLQAWYLSTRQKVDTTRPLSVTLLNKFPQTAVYRLLPLDPHHQGRPECWPTIWSIHTHPVLGSSTLAAWMRQICLHILPLCWTANGCAICRMRRTPFFELITCFGCALCLCTCQAHTSTPLVHTKPWCIIAARHIALAGETHFVFVAVLSIIIHSEVLSSCCSWTWGIAGEGVSLYITEHLGCFSSKMVIFVTYTCLYIIKTGNN